MRTVLVLVTLLAPGLALAEGASRSFACTAGTGQKMLFVVDPVATDASGKGPILVTYKGIAYDGVSASDVGPFQFGNEAHHYALIIEGSAGEAGLTAQLHHATGSASTLTDLTCETDF